MGWGHVTPVTPCGRPWTNKVHKNYNIIIKLCRDFNAKHRVTTVYRQPRYSDNSFNIIVLFVVVYMLLYYMLHNRVNYKLDAKITKKS